jgi:hypothetical protein
MDKSTFDVGAFAQSSFEGEGDTRRLQIEPKEYNALIVGPWSEKTKLRPTDKGQLIFDVVWQPEDPEQATKLGVEKLPTVRQSIFLDLTPAGGLDMGPFKNAELNKLRALYGLNKAGVKWTFQDFIGKPGKIKVEQRPNEKDPQNPFTNVTAVTAL